MALLQRRRSLLAQTLTRINLWRQADEHLEVAGMAILIYVAINEGSTVQGISKACRLTQSSGSRWLLYWGTGKWGSSQRRREGKGYIETRPDPMDNRVKQVHLTDKGRMFVQSLLAQEHKFQEALKNANPTAKEWSISG